MRLSSITYAALVLISSIACVVEAQGMFLHNNMNKLLLKELQKDKSRISGHVSVKFAKGEDGNLVLPDITPLYPTKHRLLTPVDHRGPRTGEQFNLTYWVYDKHYKKGGPIFLYLSGETTLSDHVAGTFLNASRVYDLQERFGGLGIALQHRYYGDSTPKSAWGDGASGITIDTPAEKLRYLRTDLALQDVKFLADNFNYTSERVPAGTDLTGKGSPWVVLGGSYAGNMASYLRKLYPDTFFAAYASSAPVEARTMMPVYWDIVAKSIGSTEPACVKNMNSAMRYIDQELEKGGQSAAVIKIMFLGPGGEINTNGWFAETIMFPFFGFQFGGIDEPIIDDTVWSLRNLCDHMNTDGDIKSPVTGWPENAENSSLTRSGSWSARQWATWPGYIELLKAWGYSCTGFGTARGPGSCKIAQPSNNPDDIAWVWQVCFEWGFFQTGNVGPEQIMSRFNNLEHWKSKCYLYFKDPTAREYIGNSSRPSTNAINQAFGGWNDPQPRTFYTMGENDPWSALGFLKTRFSEGLADGPRYVANSTIPSCYKRPSRDDLFGVVIKNGPHAVDLVIREWSLEALPVFIAAIEAWLPCFGAARERLEAHKQNAIPATMQRFGLIETNQTFTIKPATESRNQTLFATKVKSNSTILRKLLKISVEEKAKRLERRAKLWTD
ncbi:hypothetical protein TWF102_007056 [Orbilia oligospora]|uniref:Thymus-specific serine protease n=1 Tax=Orbilia oligospora TaxID=2813651 RepID=A0A7C8JCR9_ORBOL|nr:hypothetical protein TWF102_007056 [Orbilia oligospora]KAF3117212.1 hypothetical protein TWF103_007361 [Orbilia oligospora]KAF3140261.1 hypothetical protein TWF703_003134 [Orbilia oligospora]KAF3150012.1 hypothetical protein TWF594_009918 [Orbilia oligospora]